ncbi:hypothetical protein LMH73_022100 [Vibrio splendidus]|nr:hypothetical protein [Vibrio splendidus]MCC4882486.1 hypothetical protein [Vibrio splendidus]
MSIKKHFLFLENGISLEQIKHEAKKRFKAKEFSSLTNAQSALTRPLVNLSFSKAVNKAKDFSPFIIEANNSEFLSHDTLFLPIKIDVNRLSFNSSSIKSDHIYYYITVCELGIYLGSEFKIDTDNVNIIPKNIKLADINCISNEIQNGWSVSLNDYTLEVKTTDDGIVADLWDNNAPEHELNDNTTYILYDELISFYQQDELANKEYTDYEAALQVGHDSDSDCSVILSCGGLELSLNSTVTINDENGTFLSGSTLINSFNTESERKELMAWLHGSDVERLDQWIVESNPWFVINHEDGEPSSEIFDCIPASLQERILIIASCFAK